MQYGRIPTRTYERDRDIVVGERGGETNKGREGGRVIWNYERKKMKPYSHNINT